MSEVEEVPKLTKLQLYCSGLYDLMDKEAVEQETSGGTVKVWKGFITESAEKLDIPKGVYKRVTNRLTDLGCIQLLAQGVRNQPSVVALFYPPTSERWADEKIGDSPLTNRPTAAMLRQEIRSVAQRLGGVNLAEALSNIEQRLTELDKRLAEVEKVVNAG